MGPEAELLPSGADPRPLGRIRAGRARGAAPDPARSIGEDLIVADLDASLRERATGVRWIKARRPELYGPLTERSGRERDTRSVRFEYGGLSAETADH